MLPHIPDIPAKGDCQLTLVRDENCPARNDPGLDRWRWRESNANLVAHARSLTSLGGQFFKLSPAYRCVYECLGTAMLSSRLSSGACIAELRSWRLDDR